MNNRIELENIRKEFVTLFNREKLANLTLDEYALNAETHSKDNFCYWVETKLKALGHIQGATSSKFGVYYGNRRSEIGLAWRWTSWTNENFDLVRKALLDLYDAGEIKDIPSIKNNPLSPMFKGKILSLYFPEKFINIFSEHHLRYFLDKLSIFNSNVTDQVDLRELLVAYKNSNSFFSQKSLMEFQYYLYATFGNPSKEDIQVEQDIENEFESEFYNENAPEGKKVQYLTSKYERNPKNRIAAIRIHGLSCYVCDFNFENTYGEIGKDFIEVHHRVPLYSKDEVVNVNPETDLICVCSNCHRMLHRKRDCILMPYELKSMLIKNN